MNDFGSFLRLFIRILWALLIELLTNTISEKEALHGTPGGIGVGKQAGQEAQDSVRQDTHPHG
jgi:hypothetical protein